MNQSLKSSRYPNRISREADKINAVLEEARFCTIAYIKDELPLQIPTGFCRIGDKLYIHGSSKSHFLKSLIDAGEVSLSVMLYDGLILAPTAFNHSVNYRSVILFSKVTAITNSEEKRIILEVFTDKYIPGRMADLKSPSEDELSITDVLELDTSKASLKQRQGGVGVDTSIEDMWCGVIPVNLTHGTPEKDPMSKEAIELPDYLINFNPTES